MNFTPTDISEYCHTYTSNQTELLTELERKTHLVTLAPQMLSGHLQGRFLAMVSKMIKPMNVLEIGTFTGYGTLCLAEGLPKDGQIHTIEVDEEIESISRSFFNRSSYSNQIHSHLGDARKIISELSHAWDLIFIDAAKNDYSDYYEMLIPNLKTGAIIIADNVLWSGKVLDKETTDQETLALQKFNKTVINDPRTENVMLPIRDGLMIVRKV